MDKEILDRIERRVSMETLKINVTCKNKGEFRRVQKEIRIFIQRLKRTLNEKFDYEVSILDLEGMEVTTIYKKPRECNL